MGLRVRAALIDMVYRKSMVLSPANINIGHVMTLIANDIEAITDASTQFHLSVVFLPSSPLSHLSYSLWTGCIEIFGILFIAWQLAGIRSALAPILVVVVIILPVQLYLGNLVSQTSNAFFRGASKRLHLMTEILTAIKLVKFYAWEQPIGEKSPASVNKKRPRPPGRLSRAPLISRLYLPAR